MQKEQVVRKSEGNEQFAIQEWQIWNLQYRNLESVTELLNANPMHINHIHTALCGTCSRVTLTFSDYTSTQLP